MRSLLRRTDIAGASMAQSQNRCTSSRGTYLILYGKSARPRGKSGALGFGNLAACYG